VYPSTASALLRVGKQVLQPGHRGYDSTETPMNVVAAQDQKRGCGGGVADAKAEKAYSRMATRPGAAPSQAVSEINPQIRLRRCSPPPRM